MRLILLLLCITAGNIFATTNYWTGAGENNLWSNPDNWSEQAVPANGDAVFITQNGVYTVEIDIQSEIDSLVIGGETGTQTVLPSQLLIANAITVGSNGVIRSVNNYVSPFDYNQVWSSITNYGTIFLEGSLWNNGSLRNEGAIVAASDSDQISLVSMEPFINNGSIQIGFNTTLTLSGEILFLSSQISSGEGVLNLNGVVEFPSEAIFETDVIFEQGTLLGNSVWDGPGIFHLRDATFKDGSSTLSSNFTFKTVSKTPHSEWRLENFHLTNNGTLSLGAETIIHAAPEFGSTPGGSLRNYGTILLESSARISGLINHGTIVATNGFSQLAGEGGAITNISGYFFVGAGSQLELMGVMHFENETSFHGDGEVLFQCRLHGDGNIRMESPSEVRGGVFLGNHIWEGPGRMRLSGGAFGDLSDGLGTTTLAEDFTLEINAGRFEHSITNQGSIIMGPNSEVYGYLAPVVNYGTITIESALFIAANMENLGSLICTNGTLEIWGSMSNDGVFVFDSGSLDVKAECLGVGCSPGGLFKAGQNAQHFFSIGGYTRGIDFPKLSCQRLSAGGTINVHFENGFMPTNRSSFKIWDFQTVSNHFSSENLPLLSPQLSWETFLHHQQYTIRTREPNHPSVTLQWHYSNPYEGITISLNQTNGIVYHLEASTNLVDWVPVSTNFTSNYAPNIFTSPPRPAQLFFRTFEP